MNISQALNWARQELRRVKIKSALLDAEILLSLAIKKPKEYLYTHPEKKILDTQLTKFRQCIKRRINGEPVAYILGYKEFYGLNFLVNKNVLIPRPETEMMVNEIASKCQGVKCQSVLIDVGTGSGCVSIAIAKKLYNVECIKYYGVDISKKALIIGRKNAELHGVEKKIKFVKSDLLNYFSHNTLYFIHNTNLIITANLPYLSENIYKKNYQNLKFEPKNALLAGADGLKYYHRLLIQIKNILENTPCGSQITCFLEINPEQKNGIKKIIKNNLPKAEIEFKKDLAGRIRIVIIKLN